MQKAAQFETRVHDYFIEFVEVGLVNAPGDLIRGLRGFDQLLWLFGNSAYGALGSAGVCAINKIEHEKSTLTELGYTLARRRKRRLSRSFILNHFKVHAGDPLWKPVEEIEGYADLLLDVDAALHFNRKPAGFSDAASLITKKLRGWGVINPQHFLTYRGVCELKKGGC